MSESIKTRINFLIETNSTETELFLLFSELFKLTPSDIDYLMLYSRFLWRTCYGRTKNKSFLIKSEKILYRILNIHRNNNIDNAKLKFGLYQTYSWLAMINWYFWRIKKANNFFKMAVKYTYSKKDLIHILEWKSGILLHLEKYKEIINIFSEYPIDLYWDRILSYLLRSHYYLWNDIEFKQYSRCYLKQKVQHYFEWEWYLFVENKGHIVILSLFKIDNAWLKAIKLRVNNLHKNLLLEVNDNLSFNTILIELKKILNDWGIVYDFEWTEKYIKIFLNKYYE